MSAFGDPMVGWVCLNPRGRHLQTTRDEAPPDQCVRFPICQAREFERYELTKARGDH